MHNQRRKSIKYGCTEIKRTADIDIRHIDMPMIMCLSGLIETISFFARILSEAIQQTLGKNDAMYRAWAASNHVGIEHHLCKPTVPVKRMIGMEIEMELDIRLLLRIG